MLSHLLTEANLERQQKAGRVPSRRLTRSEYEHTLHDLIGIGGQLARYLPPESKAATFDVVGAKQEMSSVHVKGLLKAANAALDEAIQFGTKPAMARELDYVNSRYMQMWFQRPVRNGGGTVFRAEDDLIMFRGENHNLRSDHNGLRFPVDHAGEQHSGESVVRQQWCNAASRLSAIAAVCEIIPGRKSRRTAATKGETRERSQHS